MSGIAKIVVSRFPLIVALGALLVLAGGISMPAQAEPRQQIAMGGGYHEHGRAMRDFAVHSIRSLIRHQRDLGLSGEQTAKIKAISTDYAKTRIKGEADVKLAEVE